MNKIDYQIETVSKMIYLYCRLKHGNTSKLCNECNQLLEYAGKRLRNCPYAANKPECKDCETHCYNNKMREKIKEVMRYTGPRMLFYSPVDFAKHITSKYFRK